MRKKTQLTENINIQFSSMKLKCFVVGMITVMFFYCVQIFLTNGEVLSRYFHNDVYDTYMDYFNSINTLRGGNPYDFKVIYPALPNIVYDLLYKMIPSANNFRDGYYLRNTQGAQIGYIFYFISTLLIFYELMKYKIKGANWEKISLCVILLFSGPFMFQFERANIIFLALIFTMIFIFFYNHENRILREVAFISLAIAASIKIYPALFGMLLIGEKRYKEAIRTILYGISIFVIPFFYFEGFESIKIMLDAIFTTSNSFAKIGLGNDYSFSVLIRIILRYLGIYTESVPMFIYTIPMVLCLTTFILNKNQLWKRVLSICIGLVWLSSFSFTYVLIFFVLPLVLFLNEDEKNNMDMVYIGYFVLIFIPYGLGFVSKLNINLGVYAIRPLSYGMIITHCTLILFVVTMIAESLFLRIEKSRLINNNKKYIFKIMLVICISLMILFLVLFLIYGSFR